MTPDEIFDAVAMLVCPLHPENRPSVLMAMTKNYAAMVCAEYPAMTEDEQLRNAERFLTRCIKRVAEIDVLSAGAAGHA
jgi:hypothetical protein